MFPSKSLLLILTVLVALRNNPHVPVSTERITFVYFLSAFTNTVRSHNIGITVQIQHTGNHSQGFQINCSKPPSNGRKEYRNTHWGQPTHKAFKFHLTYMLCLICIFCSINICWILCRQKWVKHNVIDCVSKTATSIFLCPPAMPPCHSSLVKRQSPSPLVDPVTHYEQTGQFSTMHSVWIHSLRILSKFNVCHKTLSLQWFSMQHWWPKMYQKSKWQERCTYKYLESNGSIFTAGR